MAKAMADRLMMRFLETLSEDQARWYVGREALARGRGGIQAMHELCGMSRSTIRRGARELQGRRNLMSSVDRIRRPGGGRKRLENEDPALTVAIEKIMDENTAGDPMSCLRWTNKSTDSIAEELTRHGHPISADTVGRRLREMDYSLQVNVKSIEGISPPERDAQFRYINTQVRRFLASGEPVLSIDTKKKEQVGNFKNKGQTYRRKGNPQKVLTHDFPSLGEGAAILYGTYDIDRNQGLTFPTNGGHAPTISGRIQLQAASNTSGLT